MPCVAVATTSTHGPNHNTLSSNRLSDWFLKAIRQRTWVGIWNLLSFWQREDRSMLLLQEASRLQATSTMLPLLLTRGDYYGILLIEKERGSQWILCRRKVLLSEQDHRQNRKCIHMNNKTNPQPEPKPEGKKSTMFRVDRSATDARSK